MLAEGIKALGTPANSVVTNERWGDPYIDNRDWSTYNERLVRWASFI